MERVGYRKILWSIQRKSSHCWRYHSRYLGESLVNMKDFIFPMNCPSDPYRGCGEWDLRGDGAAWQPGGPFEDGPKLCFKHVAK